MSFKRLSIVTVFILVALLLAGQVLAAVVASIIIQDQNIDLSNPSAQINISLPGNPAEAQTFNIPITITYDDSSTRYLAFTFNYQPPSIPPTPEPTPLAETCDYEENVGSCQYGGLQTCTGSWQEGICKYNGGIDPNCRNIRCNEPPPQQQRCEEIHLRNECVGCNESQKVYQKYCNGGISGDPYAGDRQYDSACSSWCASSQPPPPPPPPPSQSCNDDVRYCDENVGRIIHKHGGYYDGRSCQYAYDQEDVC